MSKRAIETGRTIYNLSTGNKKITQKYDEIINKKKKEADEKRMRSLSFTPFVNSPYAIVGDETKRNIAYHKKNPNAQYKSSMQLVLESRKLRNKTDNEEDRLLDKLRKEEVGRKVAEGNKQKIIQKVENARKRKKKKKEDETKRAERIAKGQEEAPPPLPPQLSEGTVITGLKHARIQGLRSKRSADRKIHIKKEFPGGIQPRGGRGTRRRKRKRRRKTKKKKKRRRRTKKKKNKRRRRKKTRRRK